MLSLFSAWLCCQLTPASLTGQRTRVPACPASVMPLRALGQVGQVLGQVRSGNRKCKTIPDTNQQPDTHGQRRRPCPPTWWTLLTRGSPIQIASAAPPLHLSKPGLLSVDLCPSAIELPLNLQAHSTSPGRRLHTV